MLQTSVRLFTEEELNKCLYIFFGRCTESSEAFGIKFSAIIIEAISFAAEVTLAEFFKKQRNSQDYL